MEERCHLLPESLSVLRSDDLSSTSRGRKRDSASWDEDGDVEMHCWNERRRKHFAERSCSHLSLSSLEALSADDSHDQKDCANSGFDDEYVIPNDGDDSHSSSSEDEDDEDLDIIIVEGSSAPSLLHSASTPPSLSTSLSSLPACPDDRSPNLRNYALPSVLGTKDVDELSMAMAGGAGSVVGWCTSAAVVDPHSAGNAPAEAGALWA